MNPASAFSPFFLLLVATGGALGSMLRYVSVQIVTRLHAGVFPLGTLCVNIVGSFAIGLLLAKFASQDSESAKLFFVTGILGGFTTFSAFSWDTMGLINRGQWSLAVLYVGGSVLFSLAAVMAGVALAK